MSREYDVIGVVQTMFACGPFCGNLLAAATLKLPENIAVAGMLHVHAFTFID